jgi:hypothetical protein
MRGVQRSVIAMFMSTSKQQTRKTIKGFIHEKNFGDTVLTDILVPQQTIRRNQKHISKLDKDCFYVQFIHSSFTAVNRRCVNGAKYIHPTGRKGRFFVRLSNMNWNASGMSAPFILKFLGRDLPSGFPRNTLQSQQP